MKNGDATNTVHTLARNDSQKITLGSWDSLTHDNLLLNSATNYIRRIFKLAITRMVFLAQFRERFERTS